MGRGRWVGWYSLAFVIVFVLMPGLSYVAALAVEKALSVRRLGSPGINLLVAVPIILFGLGWMAWSTARLRRRGRGHAIHAFGKAPQPTQHLCIHGPYRYCQNPMYFGWLVVMLGVGVAMGSWPFAILVPALWTGFICWYLPRYEWPGLQERFGEEWRRWHERTPVVLPRLSAHRPPVDGVAERS